MIILKTNLTETDKYIQYIQDLYDITISNHLEVHVPTIDLKELESIEWNIGLVCGGSGSGKSTILKQQFGMYSNPIYDNKKPIISQFPSLEPKQVCDIFDSVGLSSVPIWLRKPYELSVGEKARFDLAYQIIDAISRKTLLLVDEFSSTINREVAKSLAFGLQRYLRKNDLKAVISSCHFDIIEYLQPDWIFNLNKRIGDDVELEVLEYKGDKYKNYKSLNLDSQLTEEKKV